MHGDAPDHRHCESGHPPNAGGHLHAFGGYDRALAIGVALNLGFVVVEGFFGLLAHSLALVADAGHNLSDVFGLLLAWGGAVLTQRRPTYRRTYGLKKSSIMAALVNAMIILVAVGAIAWEAVRRLGDPQPVAETTVIAVAAIGVVINGATALVFMSGRKRDINIRGAFVHMAADAAVSLGVVVVALMMNATGWLWLDPAMSLVIVLIIAVGTWGLLRDSLNMALDAVPPGVDREAVEAYLAGLPGVSEVHDVHIWAMSTTETALTVHLVRPGAGTDDGFLAQASKTLHERFAIAHATFQIENGDTCHLAPAEVV
jgi:cobalt-zinc-cadmium efflux system protein